MREREGEGEGREMRPPWKKEEVPDPISSSDLTRAGAKIRSREEHGET